MVPSDGILALSMIQCPSNDVIDSHMSGVPFLLNQQATAEFPTHQPPTHSLNTHGIVLMVGQGENPL